MKPPAAAFRIFSGRAVMVSSIGMNAVKHISTVSNASKTASLSSCISLLYASGRPFIAVRSVIKSPKTRPDLPRISSVISGFFFCGIMDEPVENASSNSINLNSQEHQRTISSEKRDRCTIKIDSTLVSSMQKSRSDTASREFCIAPSKPKAFAVISRSVL